MVFGICCTNDDGDKKTETVVPSQGIAGEGVMSRVSVPCVYVFVCLVVVLHNGFASKHVVVLCVVTHTYTVAFVAWMTVTMPCRHVRSRSAWQTAEQ